ncbi:MAG: alkyl sulfatase dimerization domain-containing protein [Acidimicrobiales bacterium]
MPQFDSELLDLSARLIDDGVTDVAPNRVTNELSELGNGVAVVESFSHSVVFRTDDGLVAFDASGAATGQAVTDALRGWSTDPLHSLVYTHGHVDHVGGSGALVADNRERGHRDPRVIGHEAVRDRFARYRRTNGWNTVINARQFGHGRVHASMRLGGTGVDPQRRFLPDDAAEPTDTFASRSSFSVGGLDVELRHARGETDDHAWAWIPEHRAICSGDLMVWVFPNAGNPQKVQRYPAEWASALREMVALEPELLLPAHGLPIAGRDRIATVLTTVARTLEDLEEAVVAMMNAGATLDEILHEAKVPAETLALPYLRPTYDEPEFVVRNIWRLYGGWWDGDPATLKPAPADALARELADLAGGAAKLTERAVALSEAGDHRLACHLIETAGRAAPDDEAVHRIRREIYGRRRRSETSLMAKGIYAGAIRESDAVIGE